MSFSFETMIAPDFIRLFVPVLIGEFIFPGTAKTGLPRSRAKLAVWRLPLFSAASVMSSASLSAAIIRFL
jgi:hypothetical protein